MKYPIKMKMMGSLMLLFAMYVFYGCQEEARMKYYDPNAPAPAAIDPVSVKIENFPGKSVIWYARPDDENLLYVKAVYETAPGVIREAKASVYIDSLVLEGYGAGGAHTAKLYSVGKNEKESEAVSITVSPETPPVITAFPSLNLEPIFGGVKGEFRNEYRSELKAVLLADTLGNGMFQQLRAFISNSPDSKFYYTGLDSLETDFAVYLQDRFGNRSDTAYFRGIAPLFEERILSDDWTYYTALPSDNHKWAEMDAHSNFHPRNLWDGSFARWSYAGLYVVDNFSDVVFPFTLTISLGDSYTLSRILIYHWNQSDGGRAYGGMHPKFFQIYGSNLDRPGDDLFGGDWELLGNFESIIPSGNETPTQADMDHAYNDGDQFFFEVSDDTPYPFEPTKFIRFRFLENWGGNGIGDMAKLCITEIELYGQKVKNEE